MNSLHFWLGLFVAALGNRTHVLGNILRQSLPLKYVQSLPGITHPQHNGVQIVCVYSPSRGVQPPRSSREETWPVLQAAPTVECTTIQQRRVTAMGGGQG